MSEGSDYTSWQALVRHHRETADVHMQEQCATDPVRFRKSSLSPGDLIIDYSKNRITAEMMGLLMALAREARVEERRDQMFRGDPS